MQLIRRVFLFLSLALALFLIAAWLTPLPGDDLTPAGHRINTAHYVTTEDGTRIAIDLWLPADLEADARIPALVEGSRYWRAMRVPLGGRVLNLLSPLLGAPAPGAVPNRFASYFLGKGYAYVTVDVRGTGASFGVHSVEYSLQEIADYDAVLDWIVAQPWSNGNVGSVGVSYAGTTAELMTTNLHPALKAAAPLYSDFDPQYHLVTPGGVYQPAFVTTWNNLVSAMDRDDICGVMGNGGDAVTGVECFVGRAVVGGVKPVDGEDGMDNLRAAVSEHNSTDVAEMVQQLLYRDSSWGRVEYSSLDSAAYARKTAIEASQVPLYVVAGWFDAGTADGALARFASFSNRQNVTIGPFSHGGGADTDPYSAPGADPVIPRPEQFHRLERFLAAYLKGEGDPPPPELTYFVMGSGQWRTTTRWPPDGVELRRYYLASGLRLSPEVPSDANGTDEHRVDFRTGTGGATRWMTQLGGADVLYDQRSAAADGLISYQTAPFQQDVELTGNVVLNLWMTSDQPDGAVHAYLDDVAPDGTARYLSEGVLRLVHRKVTSPPAYPTFGPYHSYLESDAQLMPVGVPQEVSFTLFATSALIRAGHRLRISIGGADVTSFARVPREGSPPVWQIHRNASRASFVELPVRPW